MNTKEMVTSIVTAMLVVTMFASTAMALPIVVDGNGGDWPAYAKLIVDPQDIGAQTNSPFDDWPSNYDIESLWAYYDGPTDTLYFRLDVYGGLPGDTDSDGNINDGTLHGPITDPTGIGTDLAFGSEVYSIIIDDDKDHVYDFSLKYIDDDVTDTVGGIPSGDISHAYAVVVEIAIANADTYLDDPTDLQLIAYCDYPGDFRSEDYTEVVWTKPELNFTFADACCHRIEFTGTSSNGDLADYTWDFGDGTPPDGPNSAPIVPVVYEYATGGTYDVTLSGHSTTGVYAEITKSVYVDKGPTVGTTWISKKINADTPTSVTFDGTPSYADPNGDPIRTLTYKWEFNDGYSDQVTPTVTRDVTLAQGATLEATLTVNDSHCEEDVTIYVRTSPPQEVPLLTLPGLLALIGMMCIVGAGRILTKGRRL